MSDPTAPEARGGPENAAVPAAEPGGLRIGLDNYGLLPLGLEPLAVLAWARDHGADGVQFSGLTADESARVDDAYLAAMRDFCADTGLYLEWGGGQHLPFDLKSWRAKDIFAVNRRAAEQAAALGTRVVRSCSGGLMRWDPANPDTTVLLEAAARALGEQRSMLRDHGVVLSLELHFEFTTSELLRLFERCGADPGDWLGICLDTMNVLTMLEEPVAATRRILPWVTSTHIKDGGIVLTPDGLLTFPAAVGTGIVDLAGICGLLASEHGEMNLSIEDHGGSFHLPVFEPRFLAEFPDLALDEYTGLLGLARRTAELIEAGSCTVTERERWPEICEERLRGDIASLRDLLAGMEQRGRGE